MANLPDQNQNQNQNQTQTNGGGGGGVGTKRQRRPSVRLGDQISTYYYDPLPPRQHRRSSKQSSKKVSKEALSDDANNNNNNRSSVCKGKKNLKKKIGRGNDENIEGDLDVVIGSWKTRVSASRGGRVGGSNGKRLINQKKNESIDEEVNRVVDEVNRDFEPIRSEEEEGREENCDDDASPVHLFDQDNSDSDDFDDNGNDDGGKDDDNGGEKGVNGKDLGFQVSDEMEERGGFLKRDGVKVWLKKLGLERYGPVFEIHEVDYEVLPLLTLEDLKDMGITAVGSRRKMFSAIKNFDELKV